MVTLQQVIDTHNHKLYGLTDEELIAKIMLSCYSPSRGSKIHFRLLNSIEYNATIPAFFNNEGKVLHAILQLFRTVLNDSSIQYGPLTTGTPRLYKLDEHGNKIAIPASNLRINTSDYEIGTSNYVRNKRTDLILPYSFKEDLLEAIANPWDIKPFIIPPTVVSEQCQIRSRLQA